MGRLRESASAPSLFLYPGSLKQCDLLIVRIQNVLGWMRVDYEKFCKHRHLINSVKNFVTVRVLPIIIGVIKWREVFFFLVILER